MKLQAEKDKEITKLQAEKEREITNKDKEIMKLQAEKEREITSIQTKKDKEIMEKDSFQKIQGVELDFERRYNMALMKRVSKPRMSHVGVPGSLISTPCEFTRIGLTLSSHF